MSLLSEMTTNKEAHCSMRTMGFFVVYKQLLTKQV